MRSTLKTVLALSALTIATTAHAGDLNLRVGQTHEGRLDNTSRPSDGGGRSQDFMLELAADQLVAISAKSDDFDPVVILFGPEGQLVGENDDRGDDDTNALLVTGTGEAGTYRVRVNSYGSGDSASGAFTLKATVVADD